MFMLIKVDERRRIKTKLFETFEDAQTAMVEDFSDYYGQDAYVGMPCGDGEVKNDSAWICVGAEFDWKIVNCEKES